MAATYKWEPLLIGLINFYKLNNFMKNLFLAFIAILAVTFTSCGGDDGCDSDFAGTYTGDWVCGDGIGSIEGVTVTISGSDGSYSVSSDFLTGSSLDQDGCTLSYDNTALGLGESGSVTISDSTLTVIRSISAGVTQTCTFTGTK